MTIPWLILTASNVSRNSPPEDLPRVPRCLRPTATAAARVTLTNMTVSTHTVTPTLALSLRLLAPKYTEHLSLFMVCFEFTCAQRIPDDFVNKFTYH